MSTHLGYDVFIAEPIAQHVTELVPNGDRPMWSPLSTTLIHGHDDAVLVDPPFTRDQAQAVGDWVQDSNKNLTHIFASHGHGDHWFTAGMLAERFDAQIIATAGTIEQMHRNVAMRGAVWDRLFPGQIPETEVTAVPRRTIELSWKAAHSPLSKSATPIPMRQACYTCRTLTSSSPVMRSTTAPTCT